MVRNARGRAATVLVLAAMVVSGLAATGAGAAVPDPLPPVDPASVLVPCPAGSARTTVTVTSHLDPTCSYTGGIDITASGVVLDCRGATVRSAPGAGGVGIGIVTPIDVDLSGVTIRNCRTNGFTNGMKPTRTGFRTLAEGHEFDHHLSDVVIEDSEITDSRGVGIFVDGYVERVTIRRVTIRNAGSTGIYLEAGSKDNVVVDNQVLDSGYNENGSPEGSLTTFNGITVRYWGPGREGLAIDGSWGNHVARNHFEGNQYGGIFLYKNCGEYHLDRPDRWYHRRYGATDNVIENNTFVGGPNGVWIGSRMGENTFPMQCSDPAYKTGPLERIVLDHAERNTVRDNTFTDVMYGVRVEDDDAVVEGNTFVAPDPTHHAIVVGTRTRTTLLNHPVRNARIAGNTSLIAGNPYPYRWVHGHEGTVAAGNTALGRAVPLCAGSPLPVNIMIFVHHVVVEDPSGPPTPRPDFEVPILGELPACDLPVAAPGSSSAAEADGSIEIPVELSRPADHDVTLAWSTVDPAAVAPPAASAGVDFTPSQGTVTIAAGQSTATVSVPLVDDDEVEEDEFVVVSLRDPIDATVGGFWGLGIGVVVDDDQPTVEPGVVDHVEGDDGTTVALVPVRLDRPSSSDVTVEWTTLVPGVAGTAGASDLIAASGTVTFPAGQTEATVAVAIVGDVDAEDDELAVVSFRNPTGARLGGFLGLGAVRILDDDA